MPINHGAMQSPGTRRIHACSRHAETITRLECESPFKMICHQCIDTFFKLDEWGTSALFGILGLSSKRHRHGSELGKRVEDLARAAP